MEPPRRKFRSDVSNKSIDALLNKRQRKRFNQPKKGPYDDNGTKKKIDCPLTDKYGQTVIRGIPLDMLPKNRPLATETNRREYEKPEHWIQPKEEALRSRTEVFESERVNVAKIVASQLTWNRAAKMLEKVNREPLRVSSSNLLTAKGYISREVGKADNK